MTTYPLGNTGLNVSPLCYGTLPFSPLQSYRSGSAATDALTRAFELGVNFLDTAQLYDNYDILRPALANAKRDVIIASKTYAYTREDAELAVEEARRALERDVIDIFLLHEQESEHTLRGHASALAALYDCKSKGFVRAVGLSTHRPEGVCAAVNAGLDVVHPLLNIAGLGLTAAAADNMGVKSNSDAQCAPLLSVRVMMEEAITAAVDAGMGVYTMKALGGGHLWRDAQNALTYARQWGHSLALGMRDVQEVEAAVAFFETGVLQPLKEKKPRSLHIASWCTGCGKCAEACPNGALTIEKGKSRLRTHQRAGENLHDGETLIRTEASDYGSCLLCGYCGAACPEFCIKVV